MAPLLRLVEVETAYADRLVALSAVSLEVSRAEIVALLGPNGAGKTTLLRSVAGLLRGQPRRGEVQLDGQSLLGLRPEAIARRGVGFVAEGRALFGGLSVAENLSLGLWGCGGGAAREGMQRVLGLFPVLRERAAQQARTLSGGEQQMLALGRALLRSPRLLLLDEPTLGLAAPVSRALFATRAALRGQGVAIVIAEQNARLAFEIADHVVVLENGRIVLRGAPAELRRDPGVRAAYLGLGGPDAAAPA
jgi:branched-chain amino acid transport system ATP-binding protein